jgi:hypothetical protein
VAEAARHALSRDGDHERGIVGRSGKLPRRRPGLTL